MNYKIYKIESATIDSLEIIAYGKMNCLSMSFKLDGAHQMLPAFRFEKKDTQNLIVKINNFLNIEEFTQAKGKEIYILASFSDIFGMMSSDLDDFKIFSMNSFITPEKYTDILNDNQKINKLSIGLEEKINLVVIEKILEKNDLNAIENEILSKYKKKILFYDLQNNLINNNKESKLIFKI